MYEAARRAVKSVRLPQAALAWSPALATMALGLPAIIARLSGADLSPEAAVAIFGLGILSAAFLLGAASEASQHDIPASLSLAVLAFVAVLPEYAVDLLFAWRAGNDPEQAQFAVANMTGANRLLLGIGWSFVLFTFVARNRWIVRSPQRVLRLPRSISLELVAMGVATIVVFTIPVVGNINLIMSVVLLTIFVFYLYRLAKQPVVEPEVGGPAAVVQRLPTKQRRAVVIGLFAYAGLAIVLSAEPFADGLIELGEELGLDPFLLVQWLAPIASESPEFLAALYLVWRGLAQHGMTVLISSKVNQFTLLIASLPVAYAISTGTLEGLPLEGRQEEEVLLTAAQSIFGVILILDRKITLWEAGLLVTLFLGQFLFTDSDVRLGFSVTYLVLAVLFLARRYAEVPRVVRFALRGEWDGPPEAEEPADS